MGTTWHAHDGVSTALVSLAVPYARHADLCDIQATSTTTTEICRSSGDDRECAPSFSIKRKRIPDTDWVILFQWRAPFVILFISSIFYHLSEFLFDFFSFLSTFPILQLVVFFKSQPSSLRRSRNGWKWHLKEGKIFRFDFISLRQGGFRPLSSNQLNRKRK